MTPAYLAIVDGQVVGELDEADDPVLWGVDWANGEDQTVVVAFVLAEIEPGLEGKALFEAYFGDDVLTRVRAAQEELDRRRDEAAREAAEMKKHRRTPWVARNGGESKWGAHSKVMTRSDPQFPFEALQMIGDVFLAFGFHPRWGDKTAEKAWRNGAKALYQAAEGDLQLIAEVVRSTLERNDRTDELTLSGPRSFVAFVEAQRAKRERSVQGDEKEKGAGGDAASGAAPSALAEAIRGRRG